MREVAEDILMRCASPGNHLSNRRGQHAVICYQSSRERDGQAAVPWSGPAQRRNHFARSSVQPRPRRGQDAPRRFAVKAASRGSDLRSEMVLHSACKLVPYGRQLLPVLAVLSMSSGRSRNMRTFIGSVGVAVLFPTASQSCGHRRDRPLHRGPARCRGWLRG